MPYADPTPRALIPNPVNPTHKPLKPKPSSLREHSAAAMPHQTLDVDPSELRQGA